MDYKKLTIIVVSILVITGVVGFAVYKQKVGVSESVSRAGLISNEDEQLLQMQIQEIFKYGNVADCKTLNNEQYRLGCETFFNSARIATTTAQSELNVVETKILTEEEAEDIFKKLPPRVQ